MTVKAYRCEGRECGRHFLCKPGFFGSPGKCPHCAQSRARLLDKSFQDALQHNGLDAHGNPSAAQQRLGAQAGTIERPIKLIELKVGYLASNTEGSEPRLFKTVDGRANLRETGIDPTGKSELDFTNQPDDERTRSYPGYDGSSAWKGFRFGKRRFYRFVFAFPTTMQKASEVNKSMKNLGWLPKRGETTFMYVFEVPAFTPYACHTGSYVNEQGDLHETMEVMFPELIEGGWITRRVTVDHQGRAVETLDYG